ncbi:MAG: hypothetical protein HYZ73_08095 [Elusimicrobia bacterium]|nr:hypothetical protein [Elusimicrobiota bacterium]
MTPLRAVAGFGFVGGFLSLVIARIATLGPLRQHVLPFLGWFGGAFALYGIALCLVWSDSREVPPPLASSGPPRPRWTRGMGIILAVAGLCRGALCFSPPSLSDDIYRYLWEGRVQLAGFNPYESPPNDPALSFLRNEHYTGINNKHVRSIYPPAMQGLYRLAAWLSPTIFSQKFLFLIGDVAVLGLLLLMLPVWGRDPRWITVYAWNPLVLVEFAGSGHNDSWGIFWLLLGVWLWQRRRFTAGATVAMAIGTLTKWIPLFTLLPLTVWKRRGISPQPPERHLQGSSLLLFCVVIGLGWLPFLGASRWLLQGSFHYGTHWTFNAGLFDLAQRVLVNGALTKTILGIELLLSGVWLVIHRQERGLLWYAFVMLGAGLLCSPVVHPWYVVWIIPFLCFYPRPGWILFSGLVVLSYVVLLRYDLTKTWELDPWVRVVEYVPLYMALLWPWLRRLTPLPQMCISPPLTKGD